MICAVADDPDFQKLRFEVEKDEDGWPPVGSEGLWAVPLGDGLYRLDNIPWFAWVVAADDVFRAEADDDGVLWAREKVQASGNCTIRVVPFSEGPLKGDRKAVLDVFSALGAEGEGAGPNDNLVALNVPAGADLAKIKDRLQQGEADGSWAYEEGCITQLWRES